MARPRRLSPKARAVLEALAAEPQQWRYGYELSAQLRLPAGSLYPLLHRLADRGLLEAAWEAEAPPGRPPRHMYRITLAGADAADET
jgi:PadR family transcriptional regulator, regulatory protein PadR